MSSTFRQLSASFARLSSLERRFIILVVVILFVVINLLFVLPHFSDLGKIRNRFGDANVKLEKYDKEISQIAFYEKNVKELEGAGAAVPQEDQSVNFLQAIQNQAAQSSVTILANNRQPERTNQFFIERAQALTTQSGEPQLVDFLYSLGSGSSLIRVRALSIRPDAPRSALSATITLIGSYQKKTPARTATAAQPAATPAATPVAKPATPATAPVVKTNKPAATPANKPSMPTKK
jgi:Tfp pilus assembly protein PilO